MFENINENEDKNEEIKKFIRDADELDDITDIYINFMKQRILNTYSVN